MVYCVGLTGSIASGKSTVAKCFEKRGVHTISSDAIARTLTLPNQPALKKIIAHFGMRVINPLGELNRKALRKIIFEDAQERIWLENLLHPLIRESIEKEAKASQAPYCIIEIPLLYDRSQYPYLNKVLAVTVSTEIASRRLIQRDNCSLEEAEHIMTLQKNLETTIKLADDVLINDSNLFDLEAAVSQLHRFYVDDSKSHQDLFEG